MELHRAAIDLPLHSFLLHLHSLISISFERRLNEIEKKNKPVYDRREVKLPAQQLVKIALEVNETAACQQEKCCAAAQPVFLILFFRADHYLAQHQIRMPGFAPFQFSDSLVFVSHINFML